MFSVTHAVLLESSIDTEAGTFCLVARRFEAFTTELTGAARISEPLYANSVSDFKVGMAVFTNTNNVPCTLMASNARAF